MHLLRRLWTTEEGPTAVEYAVLLALILAVCLSAVSLFGGQTGGLWGRNKESLESAFDEVGPAP